MLKNDDVELYKKAVEAAAFVKCFSSDDIDKYTKQFVDIAQGNDKDSELALKFKKLFESSFKIWFSLLQSGVKKKSDEENQTQAYEFAVLMVVLAFCNYVKIGKFIVCDEHD